MIIIGEKINAGSKRVKKAVELQDVVFIQELARKQCEAGVSFIDVNAGVSSQNEIRDMEWLINTIQEEVDTPFSIDSQNPKTLEVALKANRNGKPIINSITSEKERYSVILPLVLKYNAAVIALCMDDSGMPETVEERINIAAGLIENLTKEGIALEDIYLDPLIRPVGIGEQYGAIELDSIRGLKAQFPQVRIACGISNISFGIPARNLMNQAFIVAAMVSGIDAPILDPLDKKLMSLLHATEALIGKDKYCMNYQMKFREGLLEI